MIARTLGAIALSTLGLASAPQDEAADALPVGVRTPRVEVRVLGTGDDERLDLSIAGRPAPIGAVLRAVALETQRDLVGLDLLGREPDVMAHLDGAQLRPALRWIGGSVGLRITLGPTEIKVTEDLPPYPTRQQLFDKAFMESFRALALHPDSAHAPKAAWNRARIESTRTGRDLAAAELYDGIVERYPASELVPDALLEAGRAYGRAGAWDTAAARFDELAGLEYRHDHQWTARRLLADAHTHVAQQATNPVVARENARRALLILDWLDDEDPRPSGETRLERAKVRSSAYSLADDPINALKSLDIAARYSPRGGDDAALARLRAHAFERAGRGADAVRGWLRYGELAGGPERARAYARAADVANTHEEFLTALTIAKAARNAGFGDSVAAAEAHAWAGLDMEPPRTDLFGDPERLERAELLLRDGMHEQAANALRPVYERRSGLTQPEAKRLALAYGAALAEIEGTDEAILALRNLVETQRLVDDRRDLYLLAARILEEDGQLSRAISALEGKALMFKATGLIQLALAPVFVIPAVTGQDEAAGGLEAQLEATKSSLEYLVGLREQVRAGDSGAVRALLRATESPRALSTTQRASALEGLQDDLAELRYSLDRLLADPGEVSKIMGMPRGVLEVLGLVGPRAEHAPAPLQPDPTHDGAGVSPGAALPAPGEPGTPVTRTSGAQGDPSGAGSRTIPSSLLAGTRPTVGLDGPLHAAISGEVGPLDEVSPVARRRGDEPVPFEGKGFVADPVRLARLLVRTGRTSEAIQLLRANAKSPGERYWLARAYVAQDRIDEALELLRELEANETGGVYARHAAQDLEFLEFERSLRRQETRR